MFDKPWLWAVPCALELITEVADLTRTLLVQLNSNPQWAPSVPAQTHTSAPAYALVSAHASATAQLPAHALAPVPSPCLGLSPCPQTDHPSIVCNHFIPFMGSRMSLLEPRPAVSGWGQGTPWTSRQLITGPSLMAEATMQGANCTSGAISVFSILLKDTSACSSAQPGAVILTSDLPIPSRPALPAELQPLLQINHDGIFCWDDNVLRTRLSDVWKKFKKYVIQVWA